MAPKPRDQAIHMANTQLRTLYTKSLNGQITSNINIQMEATSTTAHQPSTDSNHRAKPTTGNHLLSNNQL